MSIPGRSFFLNWRMFAMASCVTLAFATPGLGQAVQAGRMEYEHHMMSIGDGVLHYQTIGDGPSVVISNGGPGWTCEHIEPLGRDVALLGFKVILYDQRGTGRSVLRKLGSSTVTMEKMVEDMEALRQHLKTNTWIVMGHSFGSMLSAMYASRFPGAIEKLILLSPPGVDLEFLSEYQDNLNKRLSPEQLERLAYWTTEARMSSDPQKAAYEQVVNTLPAFVYNRNMLPELQSTVTMGTYNLKVGQLVWSDLFKINFDLKNDLKRFRGRVLVVAGKQDALPQRGFEQVASQFSSAELVWIGECAHALWVDQPEQLHSILSRFLAEQ